MTLGDVLEWIWEVIIDSLRAAILIGAILSSGARAEEAAPRDPNSCVTVEELNQLRRDTAKVARAVEDALKATAEELKRQDRAITGIFRILMEREEAPHAKDN